MTARAISTLGIMAAASREHDTGKAPAIIIRTKDSGREPEQPAQPIEAGAQEAMLREIYSHSIMQAKLSFFISLAFCTLGSLLLLSGAGLAITRASSDGQRYAAVVIQVSCLVTNLLAGMLFLQANRTRKDMGAQGIMLRDDSRSDRHLKAARLLADNISDEELRNQTKAQMALQLVQGNACASTAAEAGRRRTNRRPSNED